MTESAYPPSEQDNQEFRCQKADTQQNVLSCANHCRMFSFSHRCHQYQLDYALVYAALGCLPRKKVKQWLTGKEEQIEIFYLPPYSPELNPDEHLNCDLKAGVQSGNPARSKEQLKRKATRHIRMLQRESGRVKRYFEHRQIKYAA